MNIHNSHSSIGISGASCMHINILLKYKKICINDTGAACPFKDSNMIMIGTQLNRYGWPVGKVYLTFVVCSQPYHKLKYTVITMKD